MGNKNLNKNSLDFNGQIVPNQHQLEILYQCEQGQVAQSLTNTKQYFIRQLAFPNTQTLQKSLKKLQNLKHSIRQPSMLTNLLQIQTIHIKSMCASQHRLRLVFQYSKFSLNDEIQARIHREKYLDYVDSCRIIIGSVRALAQVEDLMIQNSQLFNSGVCHRVFINPQRILVMNQGQIKIISPLIISPYDRFQHRTNSYYSPQKLSDFDYNEDQKCCLFELGITLIHVLTLKNCRDFYNGFEVKQDQIDKRIYKIWQLYSDSLICQILSRLTRTFRPMRSNLQQSLSMVKNLQDKLLQVLYQPPQNNSMKLQLNKIHNTQQQQLKQQQEQEEQIISEIQLTTQTMQSQEQQLQNLHNMQMYDKYYICDNKYETNRIDTNTNRLSRQNFSLKYSRSVIKEMENYTNQQDKEDQLDEKIIKNKKSSTINLNKLISCRDKQNHQTENINIRLTAPVSTSKKTKKNEQSCIVTNQCPFSNLALGTGTWQPKNSAYLSLLKQNKNIKQSYQYGNNDIQGGIITLINHKNLRIKQNLKTQESQQVPPKSKYRNQMQQEQIYFQKQKVKKLQWKRTQFNKKKTKINNNTYRQQEYNIQNINKITNTVINTTITSPNIPSIIKQNHFYSS